MRGEAKWPLCTADVLPWEENPVLKVKVVYWVFFAESALIDWILYEHVSIGTEHAMKCTKEISLKSN